jgi:hypothetical protein
MVVYRQSGGRKRFFDAHQKIKRTTKIICHVPTTTHGKMGSLSCVASEIKRTTKSRFPVLQTHVVHESDY